MNKRLTVKNADGELMYCVLSQEKDYVEQLSLVLHMSKTGAIGVKFDGKSVQLFDHFCQEVMGELPVVSFEECDEEIKLYWVK